MMPSMMDSDMYRPMGMGMKRMTDGSVMYVPPMMDSSCGTMPMHHRMGPMGMMMREMMVMMGNMVMCVPEMLHSMWMQNMSGQSMMISMSGMDMMQLCWQMMIGCMQMCCMVAMMCCVMMMPGVMAVPCMMLCVMLCMICCWPMNGDQVMRCPSPMPGSEMMADECWIYINGSMTR